MRDIVAVPSLDLVDASQPATVHKNTVDQNDILTSSSRYLLANPLNSR